MTTYEEDVVDIYYTLNRYFTIKNISFPPTEKRPGGKGRGEIDLLAIKVGDDNRIEDAVHVEVSVSVTDSFPFPKEATRRLIVYKFFETDCEPAIGEYLKNTNYRLQVITSDFDKKIREKLLKIFGGFGIKDVEIEQINDKINIAINYKNKRKTIEIIPFSKILKDVISLFDEQDLLEKNFQDIRMRGLQYLVKTSKKS